MRDFKALVGEEVKVFLGEMDRWAEGRK